MMYRNMVLAGCAAFMMGGTAIAQDTTTLTAAEILALLQLQREQLAAGIDPNGDTRTLEFVTASSPDGSSDTVALGTEVASDFITASTDGMVMPEELVIDLTIFFEFDSSLLKPVSMGQVDALCEAIKANEAAVQTAAMDTQDGAIASVSALIPGSDSQTPAVVSHSNYQIIGHTDASGSVQYNLSLSTARAEEVVRYMVRECAIDGNLLTAVGMGEARLKDAGNPRADANRRVEIQITL